MHNAHDLRVTRSQLLLVSLPLGLLGAWNTARRIHREVGEVVVAVFVSEVEFQCRYTSRNFV